MFTVDQFSASNLDFSTLDITEDDITIEYKPTTKNELYMLSVNGYGSSFYPEIWVFRNDEDPFNLDYILTKSEENSIQWALIRYFFCLSYGGLENALAEMEEV